MSSLTTNAKSCNAIYEISDGQGTTISNGVVNATTINSTNGNITNLTSNSINTLQAEILALQTQIINAASLIANPQTWYGVQNFMNMINFYGGVSGLLKSDVGLSNVDNTTDINKPVSTATQTALNLKSNISAPSFTGTVSSTGLLSISGSGILSNTLTISPTVLSYLYGCTSNIQTQINAITSSIFGSINTWTALQIFNNGINVPNTINAGSIYTTNLFSHTFVGDVVYVTTNFSIGNSAVPNTMYSCSGAITFTLPDISFGLPYLNDGCVYSIQNNNSSAIVTITGSTNEIVSNGVSMTSLNLLPTRIIQFTGINSKWVVTSLPQNTSGASVLDDVYTGAINATGGGMCAFDSATIGNNLNSVNVTSSGNITSNGQFINNGVSFKSVDVRVGNHTYTTNPPDVIVVSGGGLTITVPGASPSGQGASFCIVSNDSGSSVSYTLATSGGHFLFPNNFFPSTGVSTNFVTSFTFQNAQCIRFVAVGTTWLAI